MKCKITLQERLKNLRVAHNLNLEKLAKLTDISKSALGNYENDNYKEINHCNLVTLAQFYNISDDYLLCLTESKNYPNTDDMYPLCRTPSKEGIFMRYSHEYKLECIELYRQGIWSEMPEGIKPTRFRKMIRYWVRVEEQNGPDALKHLGNNKVWTPEAKYELVAKVLAGQSNKSVAISADISDGMLYTWVRKYKELGYNGLVNKQKGRKNPGMKKKTIEPKPLTESEREELIRLRAEIAAMKAEIEVVKKGSP